MKIRNIYVDFIKGDITALELSAIVNPAHVSLKMEAGLAGIIKKKGGERIEKEAMRHTSLNLGEAVATKAGSLKAEHVIHAATMGDEPSVTQETIRAACANALRCAEKLGINSIAFPALGCGQGGFPVSGAAKIMIQEVIKLSRNKKSSVKKVTFCLFEEDVFKTFRETVTTYVDHLKDDLGWGPYSTVDIIIELPEGVVLIERSNPPFGWALPGGFLDYGESLEQCAAREAKEETHLELEDLRQFHTYSEPGRDPRFQTISTVFIAKGKGKPKFGDDAKGLKVIPYNELLKLNYAFDHNKIIQDYLQQRQKE